MRKAAARLFLLTMAILSVLAFFPMLGVGLDIKPGLVDANGWLEGWANRLEFTIDHAQIDASLSNFPVLVHISEASGKKGRDASFIFDELGSDSNRKRIAITTSDGITQCYAEIEMWNSASEEACVWVKVPSIARDVDTNLYLYYDKNHPDNNSMVGDSNSTPAQNVWDANFTMVQHLDEDGNGTAGEFRDSTSNTHNSVQGSQTTTPASLDPEPGVIFDGNNDFIEVADNNNLSVPTTGVITISAWIRPDVNDFQNTCVSDPVSEGGYVHWLGKSQYGGGNQCEWVFRMYSKTGSSRPNRISFYVFNRDGGIGVGSYFQDSVAPGTWIYVTGVIDASKTYIYKNGLLRDSDTYKGIITPANSTAPLRIGHVEDDSPPGYFLGAIREVRISNIVRSNAWIKASYASEGDSLLDFGVPTTTTDVTAPVISAVNAPTMTSVNPNQGYQGQTINSAIITGTNFTGATSVSFGSGITVNSYTVNNATQITANITVSSSDTTARDVSVTTPGGTATKTGGFAVSKQLAPTNVIATDGTYSDKVQITWTNVVGVTSYKVFRNTTNNTATAVQIGTATVSSYNDTTAVVGTTYYYWVKATNASGDSGFSYSNIGWRASVAAPTNVIATDGTYSDKVQVIWKNVVGATSYKVFRNTTNNTATAVQIGTATVSSYNDTTAVVGTTYYYWVKATNASGDSGFSYSNIGWRASVAAPTNVIATDGTYSDKVQVIWKNVVGATSYKVFRNTTNNTATAVQIGTATVSSYNDTTAVVGTTYYYWVKATNASGDSGFSYSNIGWR